MKCCAFFNKRGKLLVSFLVLSSDKNAIAVSLLSRSGSLNSVTSIPTQRNLADKTFKEGSSAIDKLIR
jgi:hypothetical protein